MATTDIKNAPGGQQMISGAQRTATPPVSPILKASNIATLQNSQTPVKPIKSVSPITDQPATKEQITAALDLAQKNLAALKAKDATSASNIITSDAPIVKDEKKATDAITTAANTPAPDLSYLDKAVSDINSNLSGNESSINAGFDALKSSQEQQQLKETGQTSAGLAAAGGYLGFSGSGTGVMLNLAASHRSEMQALESKRQQAIQDARNAAAGRRFDVVKMKNDQINQIQQQQFAAQQKYHDEVAAQTAKDKLTADNLANENLIAGALKSGVTDPTEIFNTLGGKVPVKAIQDFITSATPKVPAGSKLFSFTPSTTGLLLGTGLSTDDISSLNTTINTMGYTDVVRSQLPPNVRAITDKVYYGKANPIAGSTSTDPVVAQAANTELFKLVNNQGSVYAMKKNEETFNHYIATGNIDAAEQMINALAIKGLPATQRTDFGKMGTIITVGHKLDSIESSFQKTNPSLYTTLINSGLPFVSASKDPAWLKFVAETQSIVNDYRNSVFGASLTGSELKAANLSLPNFDRDTYSDVIVKLDTLQNYAKTKRASYIQDSIGNTSDNPTGLSTMSTNTDSTTPQTNTTPLPGEDVFTKTVAPTSEPGYWTGLKTIMSGLGF
jgi:hypothetical protein